MSRCFRPFADLLGVAAKICERLAAAETLRVVSREEDMPREATVQSWALHTLEGFSPQYARALEIGYATMADKILEIANETSDDTVKDGEGNQRANTEWISRPRLQSTLAMAAQ